ncbi:hypothetical protein [Sphingobacterium sp.]|uniref:hypothetical protein n=1 Tax=Sphingobacterium sp. TaxID=341027 RepID=UPI0028A9413F|nr:hypothetical protein [Sphingobacterium sp.]
MKKSISTLVLDNILTEQDAVNILSYLHRECVFGDGCTITFLDGDTGERIAIEKIFESLSWNHDFGESSLYFSGMENIKNDNVQAWTLYAMTAPFWIVGK